MRRYLSIIRRTARSPLLVGLLAIAPGRDSPAEEPPASPAPAAAAADPATLADQVRQLAEMNRALAEQLGDLSRKYDDLSRQVGGARSAAPAGGGGSGGSGGAGGAPGSSAPRAAGGGGTGGGVRNPENAQDVGNRKLGKIKLGTTYDYDREGFLLADEDGEFQLKIRSLIQADARIFQQRDQSPVESGFYLPRARMYLSGRITKPIEYQIAYQRNFDSFDLLNAYINYHYDDRLIFRVGRFKTPYTYEYYKVEIQSLLAPERSLFNLNFQGNRQIGAMAYGQLFKRRLEYAVGTFDGARNSFQPFSGGQDVMAFLNYRPFHETDSPLKNLNIGGSVNAGYQNNPVAPAVLRTTSQVSGQAITSTGATNSANIPFLAFNSNVKELGGREQWELHAAYFARGLSLLAAWDQGYNSFGRTTGNSGAVAVPISGYFVQAAYLVTGETRNDNGVIDPLHPFDLRPGKFGLGAFEPNARFSAVHLDRKIFDGGFADPNLWTNSVYATDVGFNWYLNKYAKIYLDWQHAVFGSPVYYRPGGQQLTSDLFWFRFQLYF